MIVIILSTAGKGGRRSVAAKNRSGKMGQKVTFSDAEIAEAKRMVSEASDVREVKQGMSVILKKAVEFWAWIGQSLCVALSELKIIIRLTQGVARPWRARLPWAGMLWPFRPFGSTHASPRLEFHTADTVHNVCSSERQMP